MAVDILRVWGCFAPPEEAACRSMANAYRAGINRPEHVIKDFFFTLAPDHTPWNNRLVAWEHNWRMAVFNQGTEEEPDWVYRPNRIWCQELGDAFDDGLDQTPEPCLYRAFYNSPD